MVLEKVERNFSENNQRTHSTHITELNRIELEPAREMGIKRFGLKHGVVIEERGGEALPIPYQDRAQMWSDVIRCGWIILNLFVVQRSSQFRMRKQKKQRCSMM